MVVGAVLDGAGRPVCCESRPGKEVVVEERRYMVCHDEDQAQKDAAGRGAIAATAWRRCKRPNLS